MRMTDMVPRRAAHPTPGGSPPGGDRGLVPLHGPMGGDLRAEPGPVQQVRHAAQRVAHVEQPGDQRDGPGQRPPLVLHPSRMRPGPHPARHAAGPAAAHRAGISPPRLRPGTRARSGFGPPAPPPLVRRLGADPQQPGYLHRVDVLLEHLRGLQPQLFSAGPFLSGQAATIWVPHISGVDPPATQFTQRPTVIKQTQTPAITSDSARSWERSASSPWPPMASPSAMLSGTQRGAGRPANSSLVTSFQLVR